MLLNNKNIFQKNGKSIYYGKKYVELCSTKGEYNPRDYWVSGNYLENSLM